MAWDVYQWGKKLDDKTNFFAFFFWSTEKSEKQKQKENTNSKTPKFAALPSRHGYNSMWNY